MQIEQDSYSTYYSLYFVSGNTLYTHLHLRKDKFPMNKLVIIAQQIAHGMGYLHQKGIIHNDLKTKNIFLENGRAIIADFGLVNVARRLCSNMANVGDILSHKYVKIFPKYIFFYPDFVKCETSEVVHHRLKISGNELANVFLILFFRECMSIPKGWLCYLAPEIMRALRVKPDSEPEDLPFTKFSDVFAYGTVWYELLTAEWPWKFQPPETIIWLVGKGMKPTIANLQVN